MTAQFDLFVTPGPAEVKPQSPGSGAGRRTRPAMPAEGEMVERLERTGRYRILKRLEPRPVMAAPRTGFPLRGIVLDTETTGLDWRKDEVIEIGIIAFSFNAEGQFGEVTGVYGGLNQPSVPIPEDVIRITGITDDMVAGQSIDHGAVAALIEPADLIIAHNAAFDRPFCERFSPVFEHKAWACSVKEVDWTLRGFEGTKLGYLIGQSGYFHTGHRAVDDCFALLEVLLAGRDDQPDRETPLAELYAQSQRARVRIFAENAPFEMKDHLKARGYRWSDGTAGLPKCWWVELPEEALSDELHYLGTEIYRWREVDPPVRHLTAFDRYRAV